MTRFARAKGSKASNERVPESATPWNVMKQELQKTQDEVKNKKHREKIHIERQKNYDEFVKETESKTEKKWAEFPKSTLKTIKKKKNKGAWKITEKDVTDDMIQELCHSDPEVDEQLANMTKKIEKVLVKKANKKPTENEDSDAPEEATVKVEPKEIKIKKAKNKKPALKISPVVVATETQDKKFNQRNDKFGKNKKQPVAGETDKQDKKFNKPGKKFEKNNKFNKTNNQTGQKRKLPKERDNLEHKRRKPFTEDTSIKINGKEQAILFYYGFPVLQSDHERLTELRKSLISKGIPRNEVNKTMKLERRKAEKILSRTKKIVCFQCRESGHMLSECPQLGSDKSLVDNAATGICFKCGSTEHNYKECKVSKEFSFAKCFICREQGHISSQCPDNPRGLYPKGGACKLCGDVTHLKKDCPKHVEEQNSNSVFLNTISSGNLESIDDDVKVNKKFTPDKKKIVKF